MPTNPNPTASAEQPTQPINAMNTEQTNKTANIDADLAAIDALFTEATTTQSTSEKLSTSPAVSDVSDISATSAAVKEKEIVAIDPMEIALTELIASASQPKSKAPTANTANAVPTSADPISADETDEIIELTGDLEFHPDHQIVEGVDIAAALGAAAAKLDQLTANVQETMNVDDSFLAMPPVNNVNPSTHTNWSTPDTNRSTNANRLVPTTTYSQMISNETTTTPLPSSVPASSPSAHQSPAAEVRRQILETRTRILSELDEVLVALDRMDQMQIQANMTLQRAREFETAAVHTQQTAEALLQAETEAADAQAAYDQAQQRVNAARDVWEQAREATTRAAAAVTGRQ